MEARQGHPAAPVRFPLMRHDWTWMTFLHWRYDVDAVQRLLPAGLQVEPYDGVAWVGLLPFHMRVRGPVGPPVPWLSYFPETNVRTYVRGPGGRTGIWFFSLEAGRLPAVLAARASYQLPYFWADMSVRRTGDRLRYSSSRRWPSPSGARCELQVQVGEAYAATELTAFDHYLTARFRLWSRPFGALADARAEHPPWPLRRAQVLHLEDELVPAAGLGRPEGEPVVHFSEGVPVRIGGPRRLALPRSGSLA